MRLGAQNDNSNGESTCWSLELVLLLKGSILELVGCGVVFSAAVLASSAWASVWHVIH